MAAAVHTTHKAWIDEADLRLDDFRAQVLRNTDPADYPLASDVRSNVLFYSSATVAAADRRALQSELIRALHDGQAWWHSRAHSMPAWWTGPARRSSRSSTRSV